MTEQMKDAIRQMVAGSGAENLERVSNLTDEEALAELGVFSAHKVYHLTQQNASYQNAIDANQVTIDLLTPFINPNTPVGGFI